ncbi:unnamed protein product [Rotaria magnacalcarata]
MIDETGSINLRYSPGRPRTARTKGAINKVKKKLQENKVSSRKLALELDISRTSAQRILRDDLGVSPLVIFDEGTVDHVRYIKEVLSVALKYGNYVFGNDWAFQQDGAKPHIHQLTQQWCHDNFPGFIDKDHWVPNSPDLNPLDYCILDEFVKVINRNKVTSKPTMIQELKRAVKKFEKMLCLKVVLLGSIDCIECHKIMEII